MGEEGRSPIPEVSPDKYKDFKCRVNVACKNSPEYKTSLVFRANANTSYISMTISPTLFDADPAILTAILCTQQAV